MLDKLLRISLLLAFSYIAAYSQTYEFPHPLVGFNRVPEIEKTKGIRSIIYTEQRGEHVFETRTETFDKDGKKREVISQSANYEVHSGKLIRLGSKEINVYNPAGNLSKEVSFNELGNASGVLLFEYDSKQMLVKIIWANTGGKYRETKFIRSPDTREIEVLSTAYVNGRSSTDKALLTFNEKGQCIKRTEFQDSGAIDTINLFEFNPQGYLLKFTKDNNSYGYTYQYEYDKKGNWMERQTTYFQTGLNAQTTPGWMSEYRIISYYDDDADASSLDPEAMIKAKPKN